MFMQSGLGAIYDIEAQIPTAARTGIGPWSGPRPDIYQALPQMIDWYLTLKQTYLMVQNSIINLDPLTQAGKLQEISADVARMKAEANDLAVTFLYTWWENGYDDPGLLNYGIKLLERAGLQNDPFFHGRYGDAITRLKTLVGTIAAAVQTTTEEQASFASVIASLKAQLTFAKQQLADTEATLNALRQQAAALGITSW